ncbi:hypothetical protein CRD59_03455 [Bifidobacterium xylocopae]|uniref:Cobalamin biosynthesis protein CobQ n=2 Tax=Bifidobacterium xylocopae TaxID=2493119 RepID=A0A366KCI6_9BIFI|nr:hypothetical protein CRD59_03455 [Bifidobacterium xylocopae]
MAAGDGDRPGNSGRQAAGSAVVFLSACGGAGLSTCLALCAKTLAGRGHACAIVDADRAAGGMDVLLGLESDPGLRLSELEAPLGRMDPGALEHELPKWEGMAVLSSDPWTGPAPQAWDLDAALRALEEGAELVLVDGADGRGLDELESLAGQPRLVLAEMTVLGLARTRALLARLGADPVVGGHADGRTLLVGLVPRGMRRPPPVDRAEAEGFLGRPLAAVFRPDGGLAASIMNGLGVDRIPRSYRKPLEGLADRIEEAAGLEPVGKGRA